MLSMPTTGTDLARTPSRLAPALPFMLLASLMALLLTEPGLFVAMRHAVFDQYQRWWPAPVVEAPTLIVDIDEESLARLGQWPWPRTMLAELHERLVEAGAGAIGYDVLFAEADRTSPDALVRGLRLSRALSRALQALPDHDQRFATSLEASPAVLGFAIGTGREGAPRALPPSRFALRAPDLATRLPEHASALLPIETLARVASTGSINFSPDDDGVLRRVPLVLRVGDALMPALSLEVARLALGAQGFLLQPNALTGLEVAVGERRLPVAASGEAWLHYTLPEPRRYLPAWAVLEDSRVAGRVRGHAVLVGSSAPALLDLRFSPLGQVIPGVEVHAQLVDAIRAGQLLMRPQGALALEVAVLGVAGLLAGVLGLRRTALRAAMLTAGLLGVLVAGGALLFAHAGILIDTLVPAALAGFVFIAASVIRHGDTERRQRRVRALFSRYVSPNLVDFLVSHPDAVRLGGERRVCSFVFTDLEGYTSLMHTQDPAEVVSQVNRYLDGMIAIVFHHQGTLMKIIGDGLVVMFSAPLAQTDHARRALACAAELDAFAEGFARHSAAQGLKWGRTRIGVHSGEVIVGNFGGGPISDYSALGDPINTASRLEGANKYLGTRICVSGETLALCPDARVRPIARLLLKGRETPIAAFELLGMDAEGEHDEPYLAAQALLDSDPQEARIRFARLAAARPEDRLVAMQHARLAAGECGSLIILAGK